MIKRVGVLALVSFLIAAYGGLGSASAAEGDNEPHASYLFVFEGRDAQIQPIGKGDRKFRLKVPIRGANQSVTWFTDRPVRDAGHISMKEFVNIWQIEGDDSFKADPPNVAISSGDTTLIAIMTDPKIVADADGDRSLVSTMTLIKDQDLAQLKEANLGISGHLNRTTKNKHGGRSTLKNVSVFVDNVVCYTEVYGMSLNGGVYCQEEVPQTPALDLFAGCANWTPPFRCPGT